MFGVRRKSRMRDVGDRALGERREMFDGTSNRTSSLQGLRPGELPGRRTSMFNEDLANRVVEARRQAKLMSTDPGLSGRGITPTPGSRLRPMQPTGLEGRGVRPAPGSRLRPIQPTGLEGRGVRPAPGSRMSPTQTLPTQNRPAQAQASVVQAQQQASAAARPRDARGRFVSPRAAMQSNQTPVTMGPTRRRPLAGIHGNVTHGPVPVTMGPTQNKKIAAPAMAGPRMSRPTKIGLGIGAAAAVGVLMNRGGRPADRGRQSSYRY
jgi:hypothetical protein